MRWESGGILTERKEEFENRYREYEIPWYLQRTEKKKVVVAATIGCRKKKGGGGDFLSLLKILFVAYPEEEREKLIAII